MAASSSITIFLIQASSALCSPPNLTLSHFSMEYRCLLSNHMKSLLILRKSLIWAQFTCTRISKSVLFMAGLSIIVPPAAPAYCWVRFVPTAAWCYSSSSWIPIAHISSRVCEVLFAIEPQRWGCSIGRTQKLSESIRNLLWFRDGSESSQWTRRSLSKQGYDELWPAFLFSAFRRVLSFNFPCRLLF